MSRIEAILSQLEANLRQFIEGDGSPDGFPPRLHKQLERALILAMKSNAHPLSDQKKTAGISLTAPDQYTLVLPTVEAQILMSHPAELDRLASKLETVAIQNRIVLAAVPILHVVADPQSMEMHIQVEYIQPGEGDSITYRLGGSLNGSSQLSTEKLPNAYLIVNGLATYQITAPVINIGRDPSNQLQLTDRQISPHHAQLRFILDRFVIFDLDSQCGTFVNGVAVSSHALCPGDVIQLAGLPLVYGQETVLPNGHTQELPASMPPPEVL